MRDGSRFAFGGLLAAGIVWAGLSQTYGQNFAPPPAAPPAYGFPNAGAPVRDDSAVIDELRRRIEANEAELRALRAQQQTAMQQQQPGAVPANPAAFDAANADAAAAAAPANPFCTPKEVPIISGPANQKIGVRMFIDNVSVDQTPRNVIATGNPKELNYTGLTFLRLYIQGWVYENVDYKFEIDAAANEIVPALGTPTVLNPPGPNAAGGNWTKTQIVEGIQLKDIYSTVRDLPLAGNIRVGHFKEPFQLDELTGDEDHTFIRRSLDNSFAPARKWGVMAFDYVAENKDLSWYVGTFRDTFSDSSFIERSNEGDWDIALRSVWLPYYDEASDGRYLAHVGGDFRFVGAGGSLTNPIDQKSFSATPEALTLNPWVSTGAVNCDSFCQYNMELALQDGPLYISSEATWITLNDVNFVTGATATYRGAYVEAGYFLTGENRGYDRELKRWAAVKPYEPFFRVRTCDGVCMGKGAWQIAGRVSTIDLNSVAGAATIRGGEETNYTLALNWWLNPVSGDVA
jgi:phosphate-selective porin